MANGSVGTIDGLRRDLRSDQRQVLNAIWRYYAEHNAWIPCRILHHTFGRAGKSFVRTAIDPPALGGDVVFIVGNGLDERYQLTLLAILVTDDGAQHEALLTRYLEHVREHFWEHPDELQVKGPDVEADLGLTRDESRLLRKLVELGPFWGGSATWGDPIWQAGVPTDIEELLSITDLGGYVKERMVQTFDPNMPVDYVSRIQYSHERIAQVARNPPPRCVFISHGHSSDWYPVQAFLEKDFHIDTLEFAQEPIKGRTNLQKLSEESEKCGFAVIVMTGDDELGDKPRARENVIHEIGFFQGKYGLDRVCILHEDGTNIPSNIHGLGYVSFPKGHIKAAFAELQRELRVAFPNTNPVYGAI